VGTNKGFGRFRKIKPRKKVKRKVNTYYDNNKR
jgi:hypothetical protein